VNVPGKQGEGEEGRELKVGRVAVSSEKPAEKGGVEGGSLKLNLAQKFEGGQSAAIYHPLNK
jgi:hypothetical protein